QSVRFLPRRLVRRVAGRYIAGSRVEEALDAVRGLAAQGCLATVDILGEHVHSREGALATAAAYHDLLARIGDAALPSGISVKPPQVAYTEFTEIRERYLRLLDQLLEAGCFVGIATHDAFLVDQALRLVDRHRPSAFEFQMLMGVREGLRAKLIDAGHRVR